MRPPFLFRLFLDLLATSLLLIAFAYNGTGNLAHEIVGTVMFLLLIAHNVFNRRWYGTLGKGRPEARSLVTAAINLALLVTMISLLATSLIISQSVFSFLPIATTFTTRQIHTLVGYGTLLIASTHLGLHWSMIMGVVRIRLGIARPSKAGVLMLRASTGFIVACGVYGLVAVDVASKLAMEVPNGFGTYEIVTSALVLHHVAIAGLSISIAHYSLKALRACKGEVPLTLCHPASAELVQVRWSKEDMTVALRWSPMTDDGVLRKWPMTQTDGSQEFAGKVVKTDMTARSGYPPGDHGNVKFSQKAEIISASGP